MSRASCNDTLGVTLAEFAEQYARAREDQAENLVARAMKIVDEVKAETAEVSRARLQFDAFRWHAGKLAPKKYGDRVEHDHKGGLNFQPAVLVQIGGGDRDDVNVEADVSGKLISAVKQ